MEYIKKNKLAISIVMILLVGLIVTVYLVQIRHIFKSKASWNISSSLDIDNQTQEMIKDENKNNGAPTYTVSGDKVRIKLKDNTVENINQYLESQSNQ